MSTIVIPDLPTAELDALLLEKDTVALDFDKRLETYVAVTVTGVSGLRAFVLQGASSVSALIDSRAAAGAGLSEQVVDALPDGRARVTAKLTVPLSFSSANKIRPAAGSAVKVGRVLADYERTILMATSAALAAVAIMLFFPRFPGRRTLMLAMLFLAALSGLMTHLTTGNFELALTGLALGMQGSATLTARVAVEGSVGAGDVLTPETLAIDRVELAEESLSLAVDAVVPVPELALTMVKSIGVQMLRGLLDQVQFSVGL